MKNSNVLAALTVVGLAAATATPAMALENEFHGMFSARYINSNFNRTQTTDYGPGDGTYNPAGKTKNQYSSNLSAARLPQHRQSQRRPETGHPLELDYASKTVPTLLAGSGGAIGADSVNIETKISTLMPM
jgi:hypothetical protein